MVSGYVPVAIELVVVIDRLEEPDPVTVVGLKLGVAPEGNPVTLKPTAPENPFVPVMLTV
jgi:hypothetical protein